MSRGSCPSAAAQECPPTSFYWGASYSLTQPIQLMVSSVWTPGIDVPGQCWDGSCSFQASLSVEIWSPNGPLDVRACAWTPAGSVCGPFPVPVDPNKAAITQASSGPFLMSLPCGASLNLKLEVFDPVWQVHHPVATADLSCGGC